MEVKEVRIKKSEGKLGCFVMLIFRDEQGSLLIPAVADTFKQAYRFAWSQARYTYRIRNGGWRYTS